MSGAAPAPRIGGGGFMGGWRAALVVLAIIIMLALIVLAMFLLSGSGVPRATQPQPGPAPGAAGMDWRAPAPERDPPRPEPVVFTPPRPTTTAERGPVRRARPSTLAAYDDPDPPKAPERPAPVTPAAAPTRIAGMEIRRAEFLPDPAWWLMPGDKIPCENLEPITARTGAPFSATIPVDVIGRTGERTLIPRGSRVVGSVVRGMENGQERLVATLTSIEGPSVPGRPTVVVPLSAPAADVIGQVDLEGNVETHFWSRLGAVAAYAGLDAISTAGGAIAGAAISDAINGASGGRGGVSVNSFNNVGRSLAGREFDNRIQRPPSFNRPQGQACTVFLNQPVDFRAMRTAAR